MLPLNSGLGTLFKESLQALVPETLDHRLIVACNATLYKDTKRQLRNDRENQVDFLLEKARRLYARAEMDKANPVPG